MPGYDTRDDCVRRPGVRGRGHPVHRHYHGCHRATRLVEPREPPTMSTFTPMPSDTPRYLPSSVFVDDQLRRGMIPSPVKWRYYDPCRPGAHRWRLLTFVYPVIKSPLTLFHPAIRVCESCCRW